MAATQVRIPDDLYSRVKATAKESGRSLNGEIVQRLRKSFEQDRPLASVSTLKVSESR